MVAHRNQIAETKTKHWTEKRIVLRVVLCVLVVILSPLVSQQPPKITMHHTQCTHTRARVAVIVVMLSTHRNNPPRSTEREHYFAHKKKKKKQQANNCCFSYFSLLMSRMLFMLTLQYLGLRRGGLARMTGLACTVHVHPNTHIWSTVKFLSLTSAVHTRAVTECIQ